LITAFAIFSRDVLDIDILSGADSGFQVRGGGAHLKKLRRAEGGANIFGVFRVKIRDYTPIKQFTESPSYP
jgi:hypothetical protein